MIVSYDVADLLRSVLFFDTDVERLVYGGRASVDGVEIEGAIDVFGDLLDAVTAEANHEQNTPRRKRIDALVSALTDALSAPHSDTAPVTSPDRSTQIRPATARDLESVLRLWQEADAEPTHTDNLDSLNGLLDSDPSALLIAEDGGVVVGSVIGAWDGWRVPFTVSWSLRATAARARHHTPRRGRTNAFAPTARCGDKRS